MAFIKFACLLTSILSNQAPSPFVGAFSPALHDSIIGIAGPAGEPTLFPKGSRRRAGDNKSWLSLPSTLIKEVDVTSANNADDDNNNDDVEFSPTPPKNNNKDDDATVNVVLVTGFESFNRDLYEEAGRLLPPECKINLKGAYIL